MIWSRSGKKPCDKCSAKDDSNSETIVSLSYPCPVCGEMVDPSSAEQILVHHEHATHPRDFLSLRTAAA
jgi:hypothetical protein